MGYEEKQKKETERLGRFNVVISIVYKDGKDEIIEAKSWTHAGAFLALDLYDGTMDVISLMNVKKFNVAPGKDKSIPGA